MNSAGHQPDEKAREVGDECDTRLAGRDGDGDREEHEHEQLGAAGDAKTAPLAPRTPAGLPSSGPTVISATPAVAPAVMKKA